MSGVGFSRDIWIMLINKQTNGISIPLTKSLTHLQLN